MLIRDTRLRKPASTSAAIADLSADTLIRKDFQQRGMSDASINYVGACHAALNGIQRAPDFWEHASVYHAGIDQLLYSAGAITRCQGLLRLFIEFCERNPGITRLLTGRALTGESERLHHQVAQLYERLETQLRQYLREAELREGLRPKVAVKTAAELLMAAADGRVNQYCRSEFRRLPTEGWAEQWTVLTAELMKPGIASQH